MSHTIDRIQIYNPDGSHYSGKIDDDSKDYMENGYYPRNLNIKGHVIVEYIGEYGHFIEVWVDGKVKKSTDIFGMFVTYIKELNKL